MTHLHYAKTFKYYAFGRISHPSPFRRRVGDEVNTRRAIEMRIGITQQTSHLATQQTQSIQSIFSLSFAQKFRTVTPLPPVSFELKEKYLLVVGHGARNSFTEMVEASSLISRKVQETNSRFLLVDYRDLKVNVSINEAFNIVKRYELKQPEIKTLTMAAVFDGQGLDFGRYWQKVGMQRGFYIEVFVDFEEAERWLVGKIEEEK